MKFFENSRKLYINNDNRIMNEYVYTLSSNDTKKEYRVLGTCHSIGYADSPKKKESNCWISEQYALNGRFNKYLKDDYSTVCMYEIGS